jgi:hypothetical protein
LLGTSACSWGAPVSVACRASTTAGNGS